MSACNREFDVQKLYFFHYLATTVGKECFASGDQVVGSQAESAYEHDAP